MHPSAFSFPAQSVRADSAAGVRRRRCTREAAKPETRVVRQRRAQHLLADGEEELSRVGGSSGKLGSLSFAPRSMSNTVVQSVPAEGVPASRHLRSN